MSDVCKLQSISSQLTAGVLLDILKTVTGSDDVILRDISFADGTGKGDNYIAGVHRVTLKAVDLNRDRFSLPLIVKGLPQNIGRRKTFRSTEFFKNEIGFYKSVVPKLMDFQKKKNVANPFVAIPKCYAAYCDGENDFIVLEDLCADGYAVPGRKEGLDYSRCELTLKEFGRFHALSLAMKDQDPEVFKTIAGSIREIYYHDNYKEWYKGILEVFCDTTLDAVTSVYPESVYISKFKQFTANLYDQMTRLAKPKEPLAVISHGDVWAPNFMYKYSEDGHLVGAKLIDFQLTRYASPILDLMLFISSCTTQELRVSSFNTLLRDYHSSLTGFLKELGSDPAIFTYETLERELQEYGAFGLGMAVEAVTLTLCDSEDAPDLDAVEGDDAVQVTQVLILKPLKSKEDKQRLADVVKFTVDCGYI